MNREITLFDDIETITPEQQSKSLSDVFEQLIHGEAQATGYTSIDLFSGCGGITKGFELAGIKSIFASDISSPQHPFCPLSPFCLLHLLRKQGCP